MEPFKALYGRKCTSMVGWFEVSECLLIGPEIVYEFIEKVELIRDRLKTTYIRQKSYAEN